jgi:hypothetical protein
MLAAPTPPLELVAKGERIKRRSDDRTEVQRHETDETATAGHDDDDLRRDDRGALTRQPEGTTPDERKGGGCALGTTTTTRQRRGWHRTNIGGPRVQTRRQRRVRERHTQKEQRR